MKIWLVLALGLALAVSSTTSALAAVAQSGDAGFELEFSAVTNATPEVAFAALVDVSQWWDPAHTYGGDAAGLTLTLAPGGCLCERFDGGQVEHMRVVYLKLGQAMRWHGGMGPLQALPVTGVMDWSVEPRDGGSRLTLRYRVGGVFGDSPTATEWATIVDGVLQGQFDRLTQEVKTRCKGCAP